MAIISYLLFLAVAVYGVQANFIPYQLPNYQRTAQGDSIDKASFKMLKTVYENAGNKNVVLSPVAVLTLLTLYADAAEGTTRDEILNLLQDTSYNNAYSSKRQLVKRLINPALNFKNKVYVSDKYTITPKFNVAALRLHSEVENIDFSDVNIAVTKINEWASKATSGHIKNAVSKDLLNSSTVAALFNVIFFQGHWHVPFKASETKEKDFHVDKKTVVQKQTMYLKKSLQYGENKEVGARFLELPYQETGFRMVIALPDAIDGLPEVVEKLSETGILPDVFSLSAGTSQVIVELPRFEINSEIDLNYILPKLGVSKIFSAPTANIVKETTVAVDRAFQKAFIKVDEEGAKAGAFTGMAAVPSSSLYKPPPPIKFKVDRPFLFTILYEDIVLFTGTYIR